MPHLVSVSSTNVAAIGYDDGSSTLYVCFHHGGMYRYTGVPAAVHTAFMSAASKGGFLAHDIKGRDAYTRVG